MNIFEIYKKKIIKFITDEASKGNLERGDVLKNINVDTPPENLNYDLSTNVAMVLSKLNKKAPNILAEQIIKLLKEKDSSIDQIDFAKPGFINIKFNSVFWKEFAEDLLNQNLSFGINKNLIKKSFLIEFVSANPTGPLHVGHCRGAILGDTLANLLKFQGHDVTKEYYVNDYGNQIISFSKSVYLRIREIKYKEPFPKDENLYPGDYITEIAKKIIDENKSLNFETFENIKEIIGPLAIEKSLEMIKQNLLNLGINHDSFVKETLLVDQKEVDKSVELLKKKKFIYTGKIDAPEFENEKNWQKRDQLLFKSTDFGDDKDRALQKADQTWTYFASDIAYHLNKVNRNFDTLINILGADHAGYIKRISAAVEALTDDKNKLVCKVSQLVKLIKDNKPFKMSKRKGTYITVEDLIHEVGKDATRFIMLNRSSDVELDFDFSKVKEKSKDNPLYYVQYCYARIASVFRNSDLDVEQDINLSDNVYSFSNEDINILKILSIWPKCLNTSSNKLEPHRIPTYLYTLSSAFHSYWNMGKQNPDLKFLDENDKIKKEKLILLKLVSNVVKIGMTIIDVDTPKKM
ncbi:arginine--tRNA ligase [Candidatus Pelagibacter sp.]|nr:arginine--tRNA ligase [Candidatus Pelagibacter sp.]